MRGVEHVIEYHAVAARHLLGRHPGRAVGVPRAGDVVMFPHGDAHVVSSAPGLRGSSDFTWFTSEKVDR